jgi:glycosyltransferase involved in cell wall biosynthesis
MVSFSIIIPCYNAEKTLGRAIDSLLIQKKHINNIILIDDGSKDNTVGVAQLYADNYPGFIEYHYQENQGPGKARNRGMKYIKGEYTLFTDADDATPPDTLKTYIQAFQEKPEFDILLAGYCAIHGDEKRDRLPQPFQDSTELLKAIWFGNFTLCGATVAMKSPLLAHAKYPDPIRHSEDTVFFSHLLAQFPARTLPFIALNVYHSPSSLRHHAPSSLTEGETMVHLLFDNKIFSKELMALKNKFHAKHLISLAKIANKSEQKLLARQYLVRAFKVYPKSLLTRKALKELMRSWVA